jgi:hypothetical protein
LKLKESEANAFSKDTPSELGYFNFTDFTYIFLTKYPLKIKIG